MSLMSLVLKKYKQKFIKQNWQIYAADSLISAVPCVRESEADSSLPHAKQGIFSFKTCLYLGWLQRQQQQQEKTFSNKFE